MPTEIEVYVRGKRFVAHSPEEVEQILRKHKPWRPMLASRAEEEEIERPTIEAVSERLSPKLFRITYTDGSDETLESYSLWLAWFIGKMHARTKNTYMSDIEVLKRR